MTKNEKWLSSLKTLTNIKLLVKALGLTPQSETSFWRDLLALLKSERGPIKFGTGEDPQDSLMGFITTYADLKDEESEPIISSLYKELKRLVYDDENDSFWNQSMQKLIEYFIKNIEEVDDQVLLPIDGDTHDIKVSTLKEADAGYNLPETRGGDQWVKPWWNIDNDSYDDVRKCDEVYNILRNQGKLQYTRKPYNPTAGGEEEEITPKDWIRLLMPQYGRRVEIEDLDRNFWVIAQTIAAISAYLFDPDNPLAKMWEGLTREVSEIWENILYLWTGIAATTQKKNGNEAVIIHLPLQLRDNEHGRQYDYIDTDVDWYSYEDDGHGYLNIIRGENFDAEVEKRLAYLIEKYADKNLCIIPFIRLENYKHNYYAASWYPGVYMYHQGTKEWTVYKLIEIPENVYKPDESTPMRELIISPKYERSFKLLPPGAPAEPRFSTRIYSSKQAKDECVYYSSPFSKTTKTKADYSRFILYGCLKTSVSDTWVDCAATSDGFELTRIDIDVFDAAAQLVEGGGVLGRLGYYTTQSVNNNTVYLHYHDENRAVPEKLEVACENPTAGYPGYYMGEVASWKAKTISERRSTNLFNTVAHVIKVGSYLRSKKANNDPLDTFETAVMGEGTHTLMKGNVTESTGAGSEMKFYLNDWTSYLPEKDQEDITTGDQKELCFANNPAPVSCTTITERYLAEKGLTAVIEYLKKTNQLKQPCYIATAMGLLPWNNESNLVYWNVGALCHLYHYIPSQDSLEVPPSEGDTSYSTPYENLPTISIGDVSGKVMVGETEAGKIISCNLIKMLDSFYDTFGMSPSVYYGSAWRQFQIIADSSESCYCIITNPDDEDREVTYEVNFSTIFNGEVNYYDNRWSKENHVSVFSDGAQVGTAKKVTITESGYSQSHEPGDEGRIAACTDVGVKLSDRANIANDVYNTGFIQPEAGLVDFMAIPSGTKQIEVCTHPMPHTTQWTYT